MCWVERRHRRRSSFRPIARKPLAIRGDALDAALRQRQAAVAQVRDALEQAVGDDRLERVELQLPGLRRAKLTVTSLPITSNAI